MGTIANSVTAGRRIRSRPIRILELVSPLKSVLGIPKTIAVSDSDRPRQDGMNLDIPLEPIPVHELVRQCGGTGIDSVFITAPLRRPDIFGERTPEQVREDVIRAITSIGRSR